MGVLLFFLMAWFLVPAIVCVLAFLLAVIPYVISQWLFGCSLILPILLCIIIGSAGKDR